MGIKSKEVQEENKVELKHCEAEEKMKLEKNEAQGRQSSA